MSQVKFIQLGTTAEPKRDYLVNDETKTEYKSSLENALQKHPGAVIFTTFIKSATGKPKNEIYANGQLYSAGGSGSGAVYYGNIPVNADGAISETVQQPKKDGEGNPVMDAQGKPEMEEVTRTLQTLYPGTEVTKGAIYIYDPVDTDNRTASEKENNVPTLPSEGHVANCTAYYFDCEEGSEDRGKWVSFTGNVNAENVWFPNGISRTAAWGVMSKTTNNQVVTECKNKNLKQLLENYLVTEVWPVPQYRQTEAPTFTATDGTITTSVSTNAEYLLVPQTGTNPTVTFTYTAPSSNYASMSVDGTFSVNSTVSNLIYGYRRSLNGNRISNSSATSDSKTVTYNINEGSGTIQVGKKINNTTNIDPQNCGNSVTVGPNNIKATWVYTIPAKSLTSNGSVTAISGGTFFESIEATWKDAGNKPITTITPYDAPELYYCNNKLESNSGHKTQKTSTEIPLPTTPEGSRTERTFNYTVYQPVYLQYTSENGSTDSWDQNYYGEEKTFSYTIPRAGLTGETSTNYTLYIPATSLITAFRVEDSTGKGGSYINNIKYDIDSKNEHVIHTLTVQEVGLPYKKVTLQNFSGGYSAGGKIKLTLKADN